MRLSQEKTKRVYIPNDEDQGFVIIRNLEPDTIHRIESKTQDLSMDGDNNQRFSYDPVEREDLMVEACFKGWGNLFDVSNKELKFTPGNLIKARKFIVIGTDEKGEEKKFRFFQWVESERLKFAEEVEAEKEVAEGN